MCGYLVFYILLNELIVAQHKHIPLPANWQDLALGELISVAMSLGVGNVDEETGDMVSWGTTTLVEAIATNQIKRFGNNVRIPEYPAGHSDNIRPPKPEYPATLV